MRFLLRWVCCSRGRGQRRSAGQARPIRIRTTPVDWVNTLLGTASGRVEYGGTMPLRNHAVRDDQLDRAAAAKSESALSSYAYEGLYIQGIHRHASAGDWMVCDSAMFTHHGGAPGNRLHQLRAGSATAELAHHKDASQHRLLLLG